MTMISLIAEPEASSTKWRAIAGNRQTVGQTAGEALDAMNSQLSDSADGTVIIMQSHKPDEFFNAAQRDRLGHLMDKWRRFRDGSKSLPTLEQVELDELIEAEVRATGLRAAALLESSKL